jgi:hypothetical protein
MPQASPSPASLALPAFEAQPESTVAPLPATPARPARPNRTPAPPPPTSKTTVPDGSGVASRAPAPLLGQVVLPGAAPKKSDSAMWLWIGIVLIGVLMVAVVIGALVLVQTPLH